MAKRIISNVKLGLFVLSGLFFLVLLLYMIGENSNMFGASYTLKARFANVNGLVAGNNVRYAGIEAGTVKKINILNDTVIEVSMIMSKKMNTIIRKDAVVSIGTEGFVGNKVINIIPSGKTGPLATEGDILIAKRTSDTDEMLQTLSKTNKNIEEISEELKITVHRINNSEALFSLLNDKTVPDDIRHSVSNIRLATKKAGDFTQDLNTIIAKVKQGKGSLGTLINDTSFSVNLNDAVRQINTAGNRTDSLVNEIRSAVNMMRTNIDSGNGTLHTLFKDSMLVKKVNASLDNIQRGTDGFNQNMEALKHNFLFRGYFRKQEKKKNRD